VSWTIGGAVRQVGGGGDAGRVHRSGCGCVEWPSEGEGCGGSQRASTSNPSPSPAAATRSAVPDQLSLGARPHSRRHPACRQRPRPTQAPARRRREPPRGRAHARWCACPRPGLRVGWGVIRVALGVRAPPSGRAGTGGAWPPRPRLLGRRRGPRRQSRPSRARRPSPRSPGRCGPAGGRGRRGLNVTLGRGGGGGRLGPHLGGKGVGRV
jgi:hypothetical protein